MPQGGDRAAQQAWVTRVLGVSAGGAGGGGILSSVLDGWSRSRTAVVAQLKQLESAIRAMKDPLSDEAVILIRAIAANLTAIPDSKQRVAELRRYLDTDRIIDDAELENGFGITIRIRAPLLPALDALDKALAA